MNRFFSELSLFRSALKYEWCDVLLDRIYRTEYCADLPLNDLHQEIAKKITFEWGFSVGVGIYVLIWIFSVFRRVGESLALSVVTLVAGLVPALLFGGLCGTVYLWIRLVAWKRSQDSSSAAEGEER